MENPIPTQPVLGYVLVGLWLGWFAYWMVSAAGGKAVLRAAGLRQKLAYVVPLSLAAILVVDRHLPGFFNARFVPADPALISIGLMATAIGLVFSIWARSVLGGNWSANVTVKQGHELIRAGPYALTRHPIYTGLDLAFLGTALAIGEWRAILAVLIAFGSLWYKLRIEERFLAETFGADYEAYRRRVKAIIPFLL